MDRLNSHFLRPSPTRSRDVSGDGQSALVVKLGVSPSRSRLLTGPHRYHPGIVQQAQGRSSETAVSPHHNNQSTIYNHHLTRAPCAYIIIWGRTIGPLVAAVRRHCLTPSAKIKISFFFGLRHRVDM